MKLIGFLRNAATVSAAVFVLLWTMKAGATTAWTLDMTVQQLLVAAPETRAADAEVGARQGELKQARAWPNPTVDVRADGKIGVEDGRGGQDLTHLGISQPLAFRRLARQGRMAEANLKAAEENRRLQRLMLEYRGARTFHRLQLASARLDLAHRRLVMADSYLNRGARPKDPVIRYLSRSERLRLEILRESARQAVASAEGEYSEALSGFRAQLALPPEVVPSVTELQPVPPPAGLSGLEANLDNHPVLAGAGWQLNAARFGIDVARSQRLADPVISVFRERDYLAGSRHDFTGVMLSVQIPLWNRNDGGVVRARHDADKASAQLLAQRRDLYERLRISHLHLGHLIEQAEDYRSNLLGPSEQAMSLARRSFSAGQSDVLTLIDANNTYFEARSRYLELLQLGWLEAAELRFAAGVPLQQDSVEPSAHN